MDATDAELLRRFVALRDEGAFAGLVRRYVNLVYFAALRQVGGEATLAEEVAQRVFTLLAEKAPSLVRHSALAGWLHLTTRHLAREAVRAERRRQAREHEAYLMNRISHDDSAADWERLRPVIDETLGELNEGDREAVLLRFFAGLSLAEVGARLRLSENTARMRVDRALDKLRVRLERRGVASTGAALALALTTQSGFAVPGALVGTLTSGALAATVSGGVGVVVAGTTFMGMTKLGLGAAGVAALAVALNFAVTTGHERQAAEAALTTARQDYDLQRERLRGTARALPPDNAPGNENSSGGARVDAPAFAASAVTAIDIMTTTVAGGARGEEKLLTRNAAAAGDAFMARHPEVREAFRAWDRANVDARWGSLYRELGLSAAQIERFRELAPGGMSVGFMTEANGKVEDELEFRSAASRFTDSANGALRELLGAAGFAKYQERERSMGAQRFAAQIAAALYFTEAPLASGQLVQLGEILRTGVNEADKITIDWEKVQGRAQGILSPSQFAVLAGVRAEETYAERWRQTMKPAPDASVGASPR